jgi:hypothetical protein
MQVATASYAEVAARVRTVIAAYAQAIDDGRHADVAAMFCPEGSIDLPSAGVVTGTDALTAMFRAGPASSQARHLVTSTHVTRWSADHAVAISDLVVAGQGGGGDGGGSSGGDGGGSSGGGGAGWYFRSVGRYFDLLHCRDGAWRFHSRTLRFADDDRFADDGQFADEGKAP